MTDPPVTKDLLDCAHVALCDWQTHYKDEPVNLVSFASVLREMVGLEPWGGDWPDSVWEFDHRTEQILSHLPTAQRVLPYGAGPFERCWRLIS